MNNFNTGVNKIYHRGFRNESNVLNNRQTILRNDSVETFEETSSSSSSLATDSSSEELGEQFEDESESDDGLIEEDINGKLKPVYNSYSSSSFNFKDNISRNTILTNEDNLSNHSTKYGKAVGKNRTRTLQTMEVHTQKRTLNASVNKRERINQMVLKTNSYEMKRKFGKTLDEPLPKQFAFREVEMQHHKAHHQGKLATKLPKFQVASKIA